MTVIVLNLFLSLQMSGWILSLTLGFLLAQAQLSKSADSAKGWCNDRGAFTQVDQFWTWQRTPSYLNFTDALSLLREDLKLIQNAKIALSQGMEHWDSEAAVQNNPGSTYLAWRGRYIKQNAIPAEAEVKCALSRGNLPKLEDYEDDVALENLAKRYEVQTLLISKQHRHNGAYSSNGYFIEQFNATNTEIKIYKDYNANGPVQFQIFSDGTPAIFSSPVAKENQTAIDYLCEIPGSEASRSIPQLTGLKALGGEVMEELVEYESDLKSVAVQLTGNKAGTTPSVNLPDVPKESKVIKISSIPTGVSVARIGLQRLSAEGTYRDRRVDLLVVMETIRSLLHRTRESMHLDSDVIGSDYITLNNQEDDLGLTLTKRSVVSDALHWARFFVFKIFKKGIAQGIIEYTALNAPTTLYYLRPFFDKSGQMLADSYLVERGTSSYTSKTRPIVSKCAEIRGERVCQGSISPDANYECGRQVITGRTPEACEVTVPERGSYVYGGVKCGDSKNRNYLRNKVLTASKNGTLFIECTGSPVEEYEFTPGQAVLPRDLFSGGRCTVKDKEGHTLYAHSGELDELYQHGNKLLKTRGRAKKENVFETFLGDFTPWQLTAFITILLIVLAIAILCALLCCCKCFRLQARKCCADILGCFCARGGFNNCYEAYCCLPQPWQQPGQVHEQIALNPPQLGLQPMPSGSRHAPNAPNTPPPGYDRGKDPVRHPRR